MKSLVYSIDQILDNVGDQITVTITFKRLMEFMSYQENFVEFSQESPDSPESPESPASPESPGIPLHEGLKREFRYSYSEDQFSPWFDFSNTGEEFDDIIFTPGDDLKMELRYTLEEFSYEMISITLGFDADEVALICPVKINTVLCGEDEVNLEKFIDLSCPGFDPYANKHAKHMFNQLNQLVNYIYGHRIIYFKVKEDRSSKDEIFKEYHLYNVIASRELKVSIPNNEIPLNEDLNILDYDIGYRDLLEIHIPIDTFCAKFSSDFKQENEIDRPEERDYIFIPLINKMFEIHSVEWNDKRPSESTFWKIFLKLKQDRADTKHISTLTEDEEKAITFTADDQFEDEIEQGTKASSPKQSYSGHPANDPIREFVNEQLKIVEEEINNNYTIVSLSNYQLFTVPFEETAVLYRKDYTLTPESNFHFSGWMKPININQQQNFIFGSENDIFSGKYDSNGFYFEINGVEKEFLFPVIDFEDQWISFVFEGSLLGNWMRLKVYKISDTPSSTELIEVFTEQNMFDFEVVEEITDKIKLKGSDLSLTNFRVFTKTINEENHSNFLNTNVIPEDRNTIIVDQAMPVRTVDFYKRNI